MTEIKFFVSKAETNHGTFFYLKASGSEVDHNFHCETDYIDNLKKDIAACMYELLEEKLPSLTENHPEAHGTFFNQNLRIFFNREYYVLSRANFALSGHEGGSRVNGVKDRKFFVPLSEKEIRLFFDVVNNDLPDLISKKVNELIF